MPNTQTSVPVFTAGQILTAEQVTQINTGIPVFATTTTRDAAFGGTGEKTLAEGQFAYIEATNTTQYYDGAAWQTLVTSGLNLISSTTIGSAVSTVTVSNAFSSTYDNYKIVITGGAASALTYLKLTLGATASGYSHQLLYSTYANSSLGLGATAQSAFLYAGGANTTTLQMDLNVQNPFLTELTFFNGGFVNTDAVGFSAGYLNDTSSYTAFTIAPNTGTITGGTIRVYGYQNS